MTGYIDPDLLPPAGHGPAVVLANSQLENFNIRWFLENTGLDAIVFYHAGSGGWEPGKPFPQDIEKAFLSRYLLVTKQNYASLASAHLGL